MPIYDFKHLETGEIWSDVMPYKDKDSYMKERNCRTIILSAPSFVSSSRDDWSKTDEGFKERMKGIKAAGGAQSQIK